MQSNQNPKILHLISSLTRGGRERQLATIIANTDYIKYPTKVIFFNKHHNSYDIEYKLNDITIHIIPLGKIARLKELNRILKIEKPDMLYTWGNGESVSILLLKPFHKYKFINGSVRHGIRSRKLSHYFRTLVLHMSEHVVANSNAGLKANNLKRGQVLFNGIDEKFLEPLLDRAAKRKLLTGIGEEIPILISVANFVPYKDYYTVFRALKLLKDNNYKFYYLILGDGAMKETVKAKIHEYDLENNIQILGTVEKVADYLKISDVFIHSSKGEGCSNAILEAMSASLPVIATNTGGTPEIVTKESGFLFDYKNHQQLNSLIKYSIENMNIAMKMGQKGFQLIREKYTVKTMMINYFKIIDEVFSSE